MLLKGFWLDLYTNLVSSCASRPNSGSTMASSSRQKKKNQDKQNNFQGVLENWFVGDDEGITAYIHEMSGKQTNISKVLEFSWLKTENLTETRSALKHQRLK